MMLSKRLLILLILAVILTVILIISLREEEGSPSLNTQIPVHILSPSVVSTITPSAVYTGDSGEGPSEEKVLEIEERSLLRKKLPIETSFFIISSYDFDKLVFKVTLKQNTDKERFYTWLNDNGYRHIPKEKFTFIEN